MWQVLFWILFLLLVLPLPFKLYGYLTGADKSKTSVKVEESLNALFFSFGLIALHGFINQVQYFSDVIWQVWLLIAVLWSISALIWSPKLTYASEVMGKTKTRWLSLLSTIIYAPLVYAVYLYAF